MSKITELFGQAMSLVSKDAVDSILLDLEKKITLLNDLRDKLVTRNEDLSIERMEIEKRMSNNRTQMDRCARVAGKLKELVA